MRYVANLIDWGDMLFAQDTRETITQASQLYVLANELLGPRPIAVGARPPSAPKSYDEIKAAYDDDRQRGRRHGRHDHPRRGRLVQGPLLQRPDDRHHGRSRHRPDADGRRL